tara:strand:+ start:186 stop:320 length:135 start_codon:yes stop_codon:yes gene_type:complete
MIKSKEELMKDKEVLFEWMDANDAHLSFFALAKLRVINEKLAKL